ncbi:hypothetical protein V6615_05225 [Oscillospiraceae bacterium PP1C4]
MILNKDAMRVNATEIRGVNYVTFSFYEGEDLVFDHIGKLIENSFETTDTDEITNGFSVDNGIAIA